MAHKLSNHLIITLLLVPSLLLGACTTQAIPPPFQAITEPVNSQQLGQLQNAAQTGDAGAQYNLGFIYIKGLGVPVDKQLAFTWFKKSADQGFALAQTLLGFSYAEGQGVAKDDYLASQWYQKAADQGEPRAQINLGLRYAEGLGLEKNENKAFAWYLKAAEQGKATAQYLVAIRYFTGNGVVKDNAKGLAYLNKSNSQGFLMAKTALAEIYHEGIVVTKDEDKAEALFQKSADQGDEKAAKWLKHLKLCKKPFYTGGDGRSIDAAVSFPKASNSSNGIYMEGCWLAEHYPGYTKIGQALVNSKRIYDLIKVTTSAGKTQAIYFDITDWFGF